MIISKQYFNINKNGTCHLGRFPSKYIRSLIEMSGTIQVYYSTDAPHLVEAGVPGGILFFSIKEGENNPLYVDKEVIETDCTCKVNIYRKKDNRYVMKIKAVKGGE